MAQAPDDLVARATDPNAELTTLHELAQHYPGLRPHIAANPRTYPALLEWLGALGDPAIDAALAQRSAADAAPAEADPTAVSGSETATQTQDQQTPGEDALPQSFSPEGASQAAEPGQAQARTRQPAVSPLSRQGAQDAQALEPTSAFDSPDFDATGLAPADNADSGADPSSPVRRSLSERRGQPPAVALAGPDGQAPVTPQPSDFETSSTQAIVDTAVPGAPGAFPATQAVPAGAAAPVQRVSLTGGTQVQSPYSLPPAGQPQQSSTYQGVTPQPVAPQNQDGWSGGAAAPAVAAAGDQSVFGVGSYERGDETQRSAGMMLWVLAGVALVLVIAVVVWFMSSPDETPPAAGSTPAVKTTAAAQEPSKGSAAPSSAAPSTAAPTPSASPTAAPAKPAPQDAAQLDGFATPSGNIVCTMTEAGTSCTITQYDFIPADPSCGNTNASPFTVTVAPDGTVSGACGAGAPAAPTTLNYGGSAKNGGFACTSDQSGVSCWNEQTGKGFKLARGAAANEG